MNHTHTPRVLTAIIGVVVLESVALLTGLDGWCFGIAVSAVAGLAGFSLARLTQPPPPPPPPSMF